MTTAREATAPAPRTGAAPRELAILAGFVVLLIVSIVTVLVPALRDDARDEDEQSHPILAAPSGAAAHATTPRAATPALPSGPLMVPAPPTAPVPVPTP
jgi:hypothetical protein